MAKLKPVIKPLDFNSDLEPEELGQEAVSGLENMQVRDGLFTQAEPYERVFGALSGQPRWLLANQSDAEAYWIYATDTGVFVTDGVTHSDITPAGLSGIAGVPAPWSGGVINQLPIANTLLNGPYYWDQNVLNPLAPLPDWPATDVCNAMRPFRGYLIAMNIFDGVSRQKDLLKWSDEAPNGQIPQSWTPGVNSQAGDVSVAFNPGALVDGLQLIDRFYVYKTSSCYLLQLIGGKFIFSQRPVFKTVGALARNCIKEYRGRHIVLTDGDLVEHDGTTVNSLVDKKQRRYIFDNLDGSNFENSYLVLEENESKLYIARPRPGEEFPREMLTLDLTTGRFGKRSNGISIPYAEHGLVKGSSQANESTWSAKTTSWDTDPTRWNSTAFVRTADFTLLADYGNSRVQQLGAGADFDGSQIVASVEREALAFGDETVKKSVGRVWPRITGALGGQLLVSVGYHDCPSDDPVWSPEQTFTIGTTKHLEFDEDNVTGYYLSYRVRAVGQLSWKFVSIKMEVKTVGNY